MLHNNVLLSNVIASQAVHVKYGGVIPELASRAPQMCIRDRMGTRFVTTDECDAAPAFKQKTASELLRSDWSSDVCSSDLLVRPRSQFGDHAAVFDVDGLRGDDVRQQHVVAYHGGGCVVARG